MLRFPVYLYLFFCFLLSYLHSQPIKYYDNDIVQKFQRYIRIDTSREENIEQAVLFWQEEAENAGFPMQVFRPAGLPICVITLRGSDDSLPSIMLNSHMDVVPVQSEYWTYPPFEAHIDENGDLYGRGTQDTKDIAIQYFEAMKILSASNVTLRRTLHMTLMPDEELGSERGMQAFLQTNEFKSLNIGFALDEGGASPNDAMFAFHLDKRPWQIEFIFTGAAGHGSQMTSNSAMDKASSIMQIFEDYRDAQQQMIIENNETDTSDYTTLNVNIVEGGIATNVIPNDVKVVIDMRLAVSAQVEDISSMVQSWVSSIDNATTVRFIRQENVSVATPVDSTNTYYNAMFDALDEMRIQLIPAIIPATTDMLYFRNYGLPGIGFAPTTNTVARPHGEDEYINVKTFLKGIDVYVNVLKKLGNLA